MKLVLPTGEIVLYDKEDIPIVSKYKWNRYKRKHIVYAKAIARLKSGKKKTIYLHRKVMRAKPGVIIDHINGDTLDCRKRNLREATVSQNLINSKSRLGTSKFKGVSWHKPYSKWVVFVRIAKGKKKNLGYFDSEVAAARAYDDAVRLYQGKFARFNFPLANEVSVYTTKSRA